MGFMGGLYELLGDEYGGKWVATSSWSSVEIICSGNDVVAVWTEAKDNYHVSEPVIFYVPKKGESFIYSSK